MAAKDEKPKNELILEEKAVAGAGIPPPAAEEAAAAAAAQLSNLSLERDAIVAGMRVQNVTGRFVKSARAGDDLARRSRVSHDVLVDKGTTEEAAAAAAEEEGGGSVVAQPSCKSGATFDANIGHPSYLWAQTEPDVMYLVLPSVPSPHYPFAQESMAAAFAYIGNAVGLPEVVVSNPYRRGPSSTPYYGRCRTFYTADDRSGDTKFFPTAFDLPRATYGETFRNVFTIARQSEPAAANPDAPVHQSVMAINYHGTQVWAPRNFTIGEFPIAADEVFLGLVGDTDRARAWLRNYLVPEDGHFVRMDLSFAAAYAAERSTAAEKAALSAHMRDYYLVFTKAEHIYIRNAVAAIAEPAAAPAPRV